MEVRWSKFHYGEQVGTDVRGGKQRWMRCDILRLVSDGPARLELVSMHFAYIIRDLSCFEIKLLGQLHTIPFRVLIYNNLL